MDTVDKRRKNAGGGGPNAKSPRRKNKNGLNKAIKEEKISPVLGSDPGGVNCGGPGSNPNLLQDPLGDGLSTPHQSKGGLPDELLLNGSEIKLENPSTQMLDSKHLDCNSASDMPQLSDLGHSDFPDCEFSRLDCPQSCHYKQTYLFNLYSWWSFNSFCTIASLVLTLLALSGLAFRNADLSLTMTAGQSSNFKYFSYERSFS